MYNYRYHTSSLAKKNWHFSMYSMNMYITGVFVEWTSPLVCLPIYTKGGKMSLWVFVDVCGAGLTSVAEVPFNWSR